MSFVVSTASKYWEIRITLVLSSRGVPPVFGTSVLYRSPPLEPKTPRPSARCQSARRFGPSRDRWNSPLYVRPLGLNPYLRSLPRRYLLILLSQPFRLQQRLFNR